MTARPMKCTMRLSGMLMLLFALGAGLTSPVAKAAVRAIYDLSYAPQAAKPDRRQTLDLYLPEPSPRPPPLLVFIHGGFWVETDDDWGFGRGIANDLTPDGVAVAAADLCGNDGGA